MGAGLVEVHLLAWRRRQLSNGFLVSRKDFSNLLPAVSFINGSDNLNIAVAIFCESAFW